MTDEWLTGRSVSGVFKGYGTVRGNETEKGGWGRAGFEPGSGAS